MYAYVCMYVCMYMGLICVYFSLLSVHQDQMYFILMELLLSRSLDWYCDVCKKKNSEILSESREVTDLSNIKDQLQQFSKPDIAFSYKDTDRVEEEHPLLEAALGVQSVESDQLFNEDPSSEHELQKNLSMDQETLITERGLPSETKRRASFLDDPERESTKPSSEATTTDNLLNLPRVSHIPEKIAADQNQSVPRRRSSEISLIDYALAALGIGILGLLIRKFVFS